MTPRRFAAALALIVCLPAAARAVGNERIPVDHWCYPALERFEALGMCTLPETRPLGRAEIRAIVASVAVRVGAGTRVMSARDTYELDRLEREFTATDDPRSRYDRALYAEDRAVALEGDFDLRPYVEQAPAADEAEVFVGASPTMKVHVGDHVTYDLRYQLLFGPENSDRARDPIHFRHLCRQRGERFSNFRSGGYHSQDIKSVCRSLRGSDAIRGCAQ